MTEETFILSPMTHPAEVREGIINQIMTKERRTLRLFVATAQSDEECDSFLLSFI